MKDENNQSEFIKPESYAEKAIAHAINEGVAAVDPVRHLDQEHEHMHVVRHGPQQNFLGYREEYETEEAIKDKFSWSQPTELTRSRYPIAFPDVFACQIDVFPS
ncbi:hypothetical protein NU118_001172 [Salmonella enterica]|nr:hypothetical protein [Salmonella enterica]